MRLSPLPEHVAVSYVMPVLEEENFLEPAIQAILQQNYPGEKEIVLALGPSKDHTNTIAAHIASQDPRITIVHNPKRHIPIGLNLAIAASHHPVIIRVDAHSELTPDYTRLGIQALREHNAANVGGIMHATGHTPVQRAIARGYNSPFGLGGGTYHGEGTPGPAESAYLGIFHREAFEAVGGYDNSILRGEDWELNLRIRKAGGTVWFDPQLRVTYWPRASFTDLMRQFFATGAWRAVLVQRYHTSHPWRFFAPGTLVLALTASLTIALLQVTTVITWPWWSLTHLAPASYLAGITYATVRMPGKFGFPHRILSAIALITMHLSWGCGFLRGILRGAGHIVDRSRL